MPNLVSDLLLIPILYLTNDCKFIQIWIELNVLDSRIEQGDSKKVMTRIQCSGQGESLDMQGCV